MGQWTNELTLEVDNLICKSHKNEEEQGTTEDEMAGWHHPLWEGSGSQEANSSLHFKTEKLALGLSPDTIIFSLTVSNPVFWPPHAKSWLIGKDFDAGRDWGQEEKGTTEDEMAGWHHWLEGCESEWTPGVGDGQGGLVCCDSWGRKESDTTEQLS